VSDIQVRTSVKYDIDADGNAHVTDTKFVKNISRSPITMPGPFVQGIRDAATLPTCEESNGTTLTVTVQPNDRTHELEVHFMTPGGNLTVQPGEERWIRTRYEVSSLAHRVGSDLVVITRVGNLKYGAGAIDSFAYSYTYSFDITKGRGRWDRLMKSYEVQILNSPRTIKQVANELTVNTSGVLSREESKTQVVILVAKYRKWLAFLGSAVVGVILKEIITRLISLFASR
jgi:hypothetical protein